MARPPDASGCAGSRPSEPCSTNRFGDIFAVTMISNLVPRRLVAGRKRERALPGRNQLNRISGRLRRRRHGGAYKRKGRHDKSRACVDHDSRIIVCPRSGTTASHTRALEAGIEWFRLVISTVYRPPDRAWLLLPAVEPIRSSSEASNDQRHSHRVPEFDARAGIRRRLHADPRPRHRRQHRDLQRHQRRAAASAAVSRGRPHHVPATAADRCGDRRHRRSRSQRSPTIAHGRRRSTSSSSSATVRSTCSGAASRTARWVDW